MMTSTAVLPTVTEAASLPNDLKAVLSTAETSIYTNLSQSYLEKARIRGDGPPWLFLTSKRVGYRRRDLDEWLAQRVKLPEVSNMETV